jgi:superfamily II DNA or RNA helicase
LKFGLYEQVLDEKTKKQLEDFQYKTFRHIDASEIANVFSVALERNIREALDKAKNNNERLAIINGVRALVDEDASGFQDFLQLLSLHFDKNELAQINQHRPKTSIALSTLFTGFSGPTLESELKREIRTADSIDFLVSFIKFSGLRLIYDDLVEFTKTKELRIITTSYMGASDYKAIKMLAELPNTQVKISYDKKRTRLHAKAYYFYRETGFSTAYIGSSNISNPALSSGLEWNVKLSQYTSQDVLASISKAFDSYWNDEEFELFNPDKEEDHQQLKVSLEETEESTFQLFFDLHPYSHQKEILEDLQTERELFDSYKNLIVAATGTGKTMIAAFDYKEQRLKGIDKLLFIAHTKEILQQSHVTFKNVLREQNFGELWVDQERPREFNYVFASIQTLNAGEKYKDFAADYFDYIVVDESHHSGARSYVKIIDHFNPKILLGLTATPERMDGIDILPHFNNRLASEIRLSGAINRKLLSPFHYFAVTDNIDLQHLKWSRGGYEISELENVYTKSKIRVQLIYDALNRYITNLATFKALGFCVSIAHANFMADSFNQMGIKSVALHSQVKRNLIRQKIEDLKKGLINCIFAVDLFNEGVDIPEIDTVLFLRPTESLTVFTQQLGRGLRLSDGKEVLTVLDFIGQAHINYDFSFKFRTLIGPTSRGINHEIVDEFPNLPAGCHIHLERIAKEHILRNIKASNFRVNDLRRMLLNFRYNFSNQLNLKNFLDNYGIDKHQFYSSYSFYKLLAETNLKGQYLAINEKLFKHALRRFANLNATGLLIFARKLLSGELDLNNLGEKEKLKLGMLHYTLQHEKPQKSYVASWRSLVQNNQDIADEILEIIDYNLLTRKIKTIAYEELDIPLEIYASYTIDQIMVAFGKTTEEKRYSFREGVLFVKERNTDIFFITINKSEADYLPSTMYNDYAINSQLFSWESQSTTSIESPTGQRYINDRREEHRFLLFVRENKREYGQAAPYIFLGRARYVSHQGSRPIKIIWEMQHAIPERIIRQSHLRAIE